MMKHINAGVNIDKKRVIMGWKCLKMPFSQSLLSTIGDFSKSNKLSAPTHPTPSQPLARFLVFFKMTRWVVLG